MRGGYEGRIKRARFFARDELSKSRVILSGVTPWAKAGATRSRRIPSLRSSVQTVFHGILRLRSGRQAPFTSLRMTSIWKVVHPAQELRPRVSPLRMTGKGGSQTSARAARSSALSLGVRRLPRAGETRGTLAGGDTGLRHRIRFFHPR